jgi:hypothetical protein
LFPEDIRGPSVCFAMLISCFLPDSNIPIRWHNTEMIAHEAVIISPPYRPEDCKGSAQKVQVLNQVKKVLEGERRKLGEKEKAGGARKGG